VHLQSKIFVEKFVSGGGHRSASIEAEDVE
jgi:hypothetical protein